MTTNSYEVALNAMATLINTVPLLGGSHSCEDYEQALEMVDRLIGTDEKNPLIDLLAKKLLIMKIPPLNLRHLTRV